MRIAVNKHGPLGPRGSQHCGAKVDRAYLRRHLNSTIQDEALAIRDGAIQMDGQAVHSGLRGLGRGMCACHMLR